MLLLMSFHFLRDDFFHRFKVKSDAPYTQPLKVASDVLLLLVQSKSESPYTQPVIVVSDVFFLLI